MELSRIDAMKQRLDALRPLPPEAVRHLREQLVLNWTYHTNAIEGNTLTLMETRVVLEGITVGGKLLREHFEAINHREAIFHVNRRTARLLLNLELLKAGYPAIVLPVQRRLAYYEALDAAHFDDDPAPFLELVCDSLREAFAQYWHVLGVGDAV